MRRDIDFVAPEEVTFQLDGQDVTVRPAGVTALARMLREARPMLDSLVGLGDGFMSRAASGSPPTPEDIVALLEVVSEHDDLPVHLVHLATGLPLEKLDVMLPDRFAYLFSVVVQVNADFFAKALPVFRRCGSALQAAVLARLPAGPTPGPNSATS